MGRRFPRSRTVEEGVGRTSFLVLVLLPFRGGNSTDEDGEAPPLCAYKRPRPLADRTQSEGGERAKRKDKKGPTEVSRPLAPTRPSRRGSPVGGEKTDTVPKDTGGCIPFEEVILYFFGGETIAHICPFTLFLVVVLVKESNFGFVLVLLSISFVALETRSLP